VNRTAALTQKCTNKAGEDHWWDLNGLIYERISVMFLGAKFGNLGTKKREGGGWLWLATSIMDFEGENWPAILTLQGKTF